MGDAKRKRDAMQQMGRIALRVEGENWNAYYALPNTMEGALYLASIRMALVQRDDRKQAFMNLMRAVVGDIIEGTAGERPEWLSPRPAPEKDRSGNA